MTLAGAYAAHSSILSLSDVFSPLGEGIVRSAWNTLPVHHLNDTIARLFRFRGAVLRPDPANFDKWKAAIAAVSAGARKPIAPVLVCIDSFDGGTVIPVDWQTAYADRAKALGGDVIVREYSGDDHFSLPQSCCVEARSWLAGFLSSAG
jgi:hypothetical protein